jgi:uncharacterized pyridoxamine 5'-phosphate oxidase family protein
MPKSIDRHAERIKDELIKAGVTKYGLLKAESWYLPKVIHKDERIGGVVYGRVKKSSVMLVATDLRVIFLDCKPLFTVTDEISYEVVFGVKQNQTGIHSSVTLHTRVANYALNYVNTNCANKFVEYIENRKVEKERDFINDTQAPTKMHRVRRVLALSDPAEKFLKHHDVCVLSTVNKAGDVSGATVYYVTDEENNMYILTKTGTEKSKNVLNHNQVALTIFETEIPKSLQLKGRASIVIDQNLKLVVFDQLSRMRRYGAELNLPPVTKLKHGAYEVLRIVLESAKYVDYKKLSTK